MADPRKRIHNIIFSGEKDPRYAQEDHASQSSRPRRFALSGGQDQRGEGPPGQVIPETLFCNTVKIFVYSDLGTIVIRL